MCTGIYDVQTLGGRVVVGGERSAQTESLMFARGVHTEAISFMAAGRESVFRKHFSRGNIFAIT